MTGCGRHTLTTEGGGVLAPTGCDEATGGDLSGRVDTDFGVGGVGGE